MKRLLLIVLVSVTTLVSNNLFSQVLPAGDFQIGLSQVVEQAISDAVMDTLTDPFYLLEQESDLKISLNITLQDTNQVSVLNIKLGTSLGGTELLNSSFTYDNTNPDAGLSYTRIGNLIILGLGDFVNTTNALYYAEIEIEDASGNKSTTLQTNTSQ